MSEPILTRGAARELTKYLETPGWCAASSGNAYRAGMLSERIQLALPDTFPKVANPHNVQPDELRIIRTWLAEPSGEALDKREIVVATACLQHHQEKQQIVPNVHVSRLMDYLGMAPKD